MGLPESILNAIRNDRYSDSGSDFTVTRLIQPPQIYYLAKHSIDELEEDAADRIWALVGQALHKIIELGAPDDAIAEKRFFATVLGAKVSGQVDSYRDGIIEDFKVTSVYSHGSVKPEWTNQVNLLAYLCRANDLPVHTTQIIALYRDWRPKEALKDDYPSSQVAVIPVELWEPDVARQYMLERVRAHQQEPPPPCTDEERWLSPERWALMKKGQKRAIKLFEEKPEIKLMKDQFWEHRPGAYRRCEDYCSVSRICPQWQAYEATRRNLRGVG